MFVLFQNIDNLNNFDDKIVKVFIYFLKNFVL